jgi:hypothetical protein
MLRRSRGMRARKYQVDHLVDCRVAVLDHRLEVLFREWFPRFRAIPPITSALAA